MRFQVVLSLLAIFGAVAIAVAASDISDGDEVETRPAKGVEQSARANFILPKLFEFEKFKKYYSRSYSSLAEEARRAKLFFARAWTVFISAVKYKTKRDTKYLKVNHMSDWTPKEQSALYSNPDSSDKPEVESELVPAAELKDIKEKLAEVVEHKDEKPEYSELASELEQLAATEPKVRPKRDTGERRISLDNLMPDPKSLSPEKPSKKFVYRVKSNNPDYEQPELMSFAPASEDHGMKSIADEEAARIDAQKGANFLTNTIDQLKDFWFGTNTDIADPELADEVFLDLRDTYCVSPIKNQEQCGSCYIFAAINLYEYHYCLQKKKLTSFSEQYVIDCDNGILFRGCKGGFDNDVAKFTDRFGLELTADYPYNGSEGDCPYSRLIESKRMGHTRVVDSGMIQVKKDRDEIAKALEKYGVLYVSIRTNNDFSHYGGGVDRLDSCNLMDGHAMSIIGHGREDGLEYWLIKNSHSHRWGEFGYYKLSKGVPSKCLMSVAYIDPKFETNPQHSKEFVQKRFEGLKQRAGDLDTPLHLLI